MKNFYDIFQGNLYIKLEEKICLPLKRDFLEKWNYFKKAPKSS
jgi:hypothetical protein